MSAARICKLKGFSGVVCGIDRGNVFDEGVVYNVQRIGSEIILTPIGNSPKFGKDGCETIRKNITDIMIDGGYLIPELELELEDDEHGDF